MRGRVFVVLFSAVAAAVSPAIAQGDHLGPAEARRIFYGIDMQGAHQPSGVDWRECIDPDGKTAFWFAGRYDEGRLSIRRDGALCFSYASSGFREQSCWTVKRVDATNYRFENSDGEAGFFETKRTRPAQSCPGREAAVS